MTGTSKIYDLKRIFRTSFVGRSKMYLAMRYILHVKEVDATISKHIGYNVSSQQIRLLKKEMRKAMIRYRWDFDEFFLFHFMNYDEAKRKSFVPEYDKNIFCDLVNDESQAEVFLDKWTTYVHFKEYFGRDVCDIRAKEDINAKECVTFITQHPSFIVKPVFGTRGAGIRILHTQSKEEALKQLHEIYDSGEHALFLEELLSADERISALHPGSLNTLRVITINYGDKVDIIHAWLRIGQGNSIIDNTSAGGVFGVIDVQSGQIYGACDRLSHTFEKHPDSGINLIGFQIPRWDEVKDLVVKAAHVLPKVRYVGWDVAITPNGCVLVEGNDKGRWSFQFPKQEGARDEMNKILRAFRKPEII